jgi:hypothetical protein
MVALILTEDATEIWKPAEVLLPSMLHDIITVISCILILIPTAAEVGKVTFVSNGDEALSNDSL